MVIKRDLTLTAFPCQRKACRSFNEEEVEERRKLTKGSVAGRLLTGFLIKKRLFLRKRAGERVPTLFYMKKSKKQESTSLYQGDA